MSHSCNVTRFRWFARICPSSNRFVTKISALSCNASKVMRCKRPSGMYFCRISRTSSWNGRRGMSKLVVFCNRLISFRAACPGRCRFRCGCTCFRGRRFNYRKNCARNQNKMINTFCFPFVNRNASFNIYRVILCRISTIWWFTWRSARWTRIGDTTCTFRWWLPQKIHTTCTWRYTCKSWGRSLCCTCHVDELNHSKLDSNSRNALAKEKSCKRSHSIKCQLTTDSIDIKLLLASVDFLSFGSLAHRCNWICY